MVASHLRLALLSLLILVANIRHASSETCHGVTAGTCGAFNNCGTLAFGSYCELHYTPASNYRELRCFNININFGTLFAPCTDLGCNAFYARFGFYWGSTLLATDCSRVWSGGASYIPSFTTTFGGTMNSYPGWTLYFTIAPQRFNVCGNGGTCTGHNTGTSNAILMTITGKVSMLLYDALMHSYLFLCSSKLLQRRVFFLQNTVYFGCATVYCLHQWIYAIWWQLQ